MLNYFTTWNTIFILYPNLRKENSRALLALSSSISLAGIAMWIGNLKKNCWKWKDVNTNIFYYSILDLLFHQAPLLLALNQKPSGNALQALIPASIYCIFVPNPYKLGRYKLKNYHGILLLGTIAPIVNHLTRNNPTRFIQ